MADLLDHIPQTQIVPPGQYGLDGAGVVVTLVEGARIASIVAARSEPLDATLPAGANCATIADVSFVGTGPGRWLAIGFEPIDLEDRLRSAYPSAAVCDQSDGYVLFDVAGPRARDALAKGVAIDLDPRAFRPGDAATTSVALIGTTFWLTDEAPTFRFAVGRSFAPDFSRFVVSSAAEFGCIVTSGLRRPPAD